MTPEPVLPLLVFGWGNLSRGDDALGPLCVEQLRAECTASAGVEFLDDYQLQVEHALDLVGRTRILFVVSALSWVNPPALRLWRTWRPRRSGPGPGCSHSESG